MGSEVHFANLINLKSFSAFGNLLILRVSPDWFPPFNLNLLEIGSWNLGPQFPKWLKSQKGLHSVAPHKTKIGFGINQVIFSTLTCVIINYPENSQLCSPLLVSQ